MTNLLQKHCVPCEGAVPPLPQSDAEKLLKEACADWKLSDGKKISREFKLKNFKEALQFVNKVAHLAEAEGHHPDILVHYNRVTLELWTHAIDGLSENDFIMAAKIDALM